jgi:hypothetical protein
MQKLCKQHVTPHTYGEETRRKATKWAFLGKRSIPPGLDEDDPSVTAVAIAAADDLGGTCEIPGR